MNIERIIILGISALVVIIAYLVGKIRGRMYRAKSYRGLLDVIGKDKWVTVSGNQNKCPDCAGEGE